MRPTARLVRHHSRVTRLRQRAPTHSRHQTVAHAGLVRHLTRLIPFIRLTTHLLPFLRATRRHRVTRTVRRPHTVATFLVRVRRTHRHPPVFNNTRQRLPMTFNMVNRLQVARPHTTLRHRTRGRIRTLPNTRTLRYLHRNLRNSTVILHNAINHDSRRHYSLQVVTSLTFRPHRIRTIEVRTTFSHWLRIDRRQYTINQFAPTFRVRQRHRTQHRHQGLTQRFFTDIRRRVL